jgi:hypothetical protein
MREREWKGELCGSLHFTRRKEKIACFEDSKPVLFGPSDTDRVKRWEAKHEIRLNNIQILTPYLTAKTLYFHFKEQLFDYM